MTADQTGTAPRLRQGPSPIFLGLVALAIVTGTLLYFGVGPPGFVSFLFVASAWVVTLCLHEFFHAYIAYRGGDSSVVHRGYLTLDPLKYTHPVFSLVLPLVFLILGGIGLPGGAVFINQNALRTPARRSAVSAAGPLTNVTIAIILAITVTLRDGNSAFWAAMAFLVFLQVTAAVLNFLPVPGLDGYGILEPYLAPRLRARAARIAPFAILGLFALLWIPALNAAFFGFINAILALLGVPNILWASGFALFRFWG